MPNAAVARRSDPMQRSRKRRRKCIAEPPIHALQAKFARPTEAPSNKVPPVIVAGRCLSTERPSGSLVRCREAGNVPCRLRNTAICEADTTDQAWRAAVRSVVGLFVTLALKNECGLTVGGEQRGKHQD